MIKSVLKLLQGYLQYDVNGKRFYLYKNAVKHFNTVQAGELNGLNFFIGWALLEKKEAKTKGQRPPKAAPRIPR